MIVDTELQTEVVGWHCVFNGMYYARANTTEFFIYRNYMKTI